MNTNLTLAEIIEIVTAQSVVDQRTIKTASNVSIKAKLATEVITGTVDKEKAIAEARAKGAEYIKSTPIGTIITVSTADGTYNMEIKGINLEKSTVTGFKLDDAGMKVLGANGKPVTAWRHFENVVAPVIAVPALEEEEIDA